MLEIRNLSVTYGSFTAVSDFSLELAPGEIVTLVGPTGCGKSSVLRAVAGLEKPAAGEIRIGDLRIDRDNPVPPERRRVGLVFQDFALFPHLTVEQNIAFRVSEPSLVEEWLVRLGLEPYRAKMPATLSGGQKQRVALARCLAHRPAIVLLDEPLSNLDAAMKSGLRWQIREALKAAHVPAIWVTHDQDEALSVADRVGIMNAGRLEQVGEPERCYRVPVTRFVAEFLGEGVFLPGRVSGDRVETVLGESRLIEPGEHQHAEEPDVDVLVRPHDLALEPAAAGGNAKVLWVRYEGETRLYNLLLDTGGELKARVSHELRIEEGQRVQAWIAAGHPLPAFASVPGAQASVKPRQQPEKVSRYG